jgi:arylsulfatase A-like enzyme
VIPKSAATVAEVLKDYGYSTGAWGKWHNTPAEQTTAAGPFGTISELLAQNGIPTTIQQHIKAMNGRWSLALERP